ncbi:hypothetical protein FOZ60_014242, partial [Perkinsus olseni]
CGLVIMFADSFFVLKLRYGAESLRCRCPLKTVKAVSNLYREAWPALKTSKYTVQVHKGRDLSSYAESTEISTLLDSHGVMYAGSPKELRLNVKGGPEATPGEKSLLEPSEAYGRPYSCCSALGQLPRLWDGTNYWTLSHTLTVVSLAVNGIWDSRDDAAVCEGFLREMRSVGAAWPGDVAKIKDLQLPDSSLPLMVAETFPKDDPPSEDSSNPPLQGWLFLHQLQNILPLLFRCDGLGGDINLCDPCYLTHRSKILKIANKCSRIVTPSYWNEGNTQAVELVHYGSTCDGCGVSPIVGRRYKCNYCAEYELCSRCFKEPANKQHRLEHLFTLIARPAKLWTVHTKNQKGTLYSEMKCEMCGVLPPGGARYTIKCDCKAQMCLDCYKDDLQGQAVLLRGEFFDYPNPVSLQASMDRERQRHVLKISVASLLLLGPMEKAARMAAEGKVVEEDDKMAKGRVIWADELPREVKPHHRVVRTGCGCGHRH